MAPRTRQNMMRTERKPEMLLLQNLLALARASAGSRMFRKLYFKFGNAASAKKLDVLFDGDLSCAFFVSSLLKLLGLIGELHTTVRSTVAELKKSGWKEIKKPRPGAVIVWGSKYSKDTGEWHQHIGIYIGNGNAANNSSKKRTPVIKKWDFRPVEKIYWHPKLK